MIFLVALALAIFVLPSPWGVVAVAAGGAAELVEAGLLWRWSHRRAPAVGAEALIGARAVVDSPCRPLGWVRVHGELWQASCEDGADEGAVVEVIAVEKLTLVVEPP
ncbi:MAG: NfeD family protein [Actinobacteria bacterium]|nr:NfeD family protein [Actinomycetota bacterium]